MKKRQLSICLLFAIATLAGCGTNADGERCNPLRAKIRDAHPTCQPDPSLTSVCMLDGGASD
jgi:hypothetical protein